MNDDYNIWTDCGKSKDAKITQLYKVGVYGIMNNNPAQQFNATPMQLKASEKKLAKALAKGDLESLELLMPITVTDESGFWEQVTE